MHNSYFLLKQLIPELRMLLTGYSIHDCFSQNKNELIIRFTKDDDEKIIIARVDPKFTCLSFPAEYGKAKKNTAAIFNEVIDKKVIDIIGFVNERALLIKLDHGYSLLLKLFGQQSNIVLFKDEAVIDIFRRGLKGDFQTSLSELNRPLDQSKKAILKDLGDLKQVLPTLDRKMRTALIDKIKGLAEQEAYRIISEFVESIENPQGFKIIEESGKIKLTLLDPTDFIESYQSPSVALTKFYRLYLQQSGLLSTKTLLIKKLEQQTIRTEAYIKKTQFKLISLKDNLSYKETADIIMANLHLIKAKSTKADLLNFYTDEIVTIKLNPRLNSQQNAEKYYNKSKKFSIELKKLEESINSKNQLLEKLKNSLDEVRKSTKSSDLKKFIKEKQQNLPKESLPYKKFNIDGFTILVGKNAKTNDLLTLKIAKKEDLFFHAKDVAGSHVILKQISGKSISKITLEKTAALAAYYSKRKTDSLCPVGYTHKKYVRKPKGSAPGLVIVDREKVLLVKPKAPQ